MGTKSVSACLLILYIKNVRLIIIADTNNRREPVHSLIGDKPLIPTIEIKVIENLTP